MNGQERVSRLRVFIRPQLLFLVPLALYLMPLDTGPFVMMKLILLVPCIVMITVPAMLLSPLGLSLYKFGEFGALPQNAVAWGVVFLFWSLVAFGWSTWRVRRVLES